jgi:hypothetical protein
MWHETKHVIRAIRIEREARAWLSANDPIWVACYAMRRLNRHAPTLNKRNPSRTCIYEAKDKLIRWLYANVNPVEVTLDQQRLPCYHCDENGTSYYWRDEWGDYENDNHDPGGHSCEWCGGTHIYKTIPLYRFVFDVDGHRFVWHQPESSVWNGIMLTSDNGHDYVTREPVADNHLSTDHANVLYIAIQLFMSDRQAGPRVVRRGIRDVLFAILHDITHTASIYLRDWYFGCKLWLFCRKKYLLDWLSGKPRIKVTRDQDEIEF